MTANQADNYMRAQDDIPFPTSPKGVVSPVKNIPETPLVGPLGEIPVRKMKLFTLEEVEECENEPLQIYSKHVR